MDDLQIVDLFFERDENALKETEKKYSKLCHFIAGNILLSKEDVEECVNDTYLKVWSSIPPQRPENLKAYIGKITRNLALDKHDRNNAKKRKGSTLLIYDEVCEIIPDSSSQDLSDELVLKDALNKFLGSLKQEKRIIFLQRYWYLSSVKDIAENNGLSENNVKITLLRLRAKLKKFLEKEGISL